MRTKDQFLKGDLIALVNRDVKIIKGREILAVGKLKKKRTKLDKIYYVEIEYLTLSFKEDKVGAVFGSTGTVYSFPEIHLTRKYK